MSDFSNNYLPSNTGTLLDQIAIRKSSQMQEGGVVPVVFGTCKVQGQPLWMGNIAISTSLAKLQRYGDATQAYLAKAWYAICMGKVHLLKIQANDKTLVDPTDYSISYFNDGTGSYKPTLTSGITYIVIATDTIGTSEDMTTFSFKGISSAVIKSVAFDGNIFVIVCNSGKIYTSIDCINWTLRSSGVSPNLNKVIHNGNIFVAIGDSGIILTSPDGILWENRTSGTALHLYSICWNGSKFCIVGASRITLQSTDGIIWAIYYVPDGAGPVINLYDVTWGNSLFAACSEGMTIYTSADGQTWVARTSYEISYSLKSITYSASLSLFISVGATGGYCYYSSDGISWDTHTLLTTDDMYSISFDGTKFIAVGDNGMIQSTVNALTWIKITFPYSYDISIIFYNTANYFSWVSKLKGIAHQYFPNGIIDNRVVCDSNGTLPTMNFNINNMLESSPISNAIILMENGEYTNNPVAVIYEILTNKQWGRGLDATTYIDMTSFNNVASTFTADRPYGISFSIQEISTAKDIIQKIQEMTDVILYEDGGKFKLGLLYEKGAVSRLTINDDDIRDINIERQTWSSLDNSFEAEYIEPALNFEPKTITVKNEAAILAAGSERKKKIDLTYFISPVVASARLNEIMQRESYPKTTITGKINREAYNIRPGNIIGIYNTEYGISGNYRVVRIDPGKINEMDISVEMVQIFEDLWDEEYQTAIAAKGTIPAFVSGRESGSGTGFESHARLHSITSTADHSSTATPGKYLIADTNGLPISTDDSPDNRLFTPIADPDAVSGKWQLYLHTSLEWHVRSSIEDGGVIEKLAKSSIDMGL